MTGDVVSDDVRCPVCGGGSRALSELAQDRTRRELGEVFGEPVPSEIEVGSYTLRRCEQCTVEFAWPMRPGDSKFYGWVTKFPRYHAARRWEWRRAKSILAAERRPIRLLDIGCGSGAFLDYIADLDHVTSLGIDTSAESTGRAKARGFETLTGEFGDLLDDLKARGPFDVIVATHVLEHLDDPRRFIEQCASLLSPGGYALISTPYSPLSRELWRNDVMNLPPHHLTRWNANAYRNMGDLTHLETRIHAPRAKSALKRSIRQTCIRVAGEDRRFSVVERIKLLAGHPGAFADTLSKTLGREKIGGRAAPDKILVQFVNPA